MVNVRRRPSNFMLTLNTILCIFAIITTIYATASYIWSRTQTGQQHVVQPVTGTAFNFTLKEGYVGVPSYELVTPSPILNITTKTANLTLQISCMNYLELQGKYYDLTLRLYRHSNSTLLGELNLRSNTILNYTMTTPGNYLFDYKIDYTPKIEGYNTINLLVTVQK